MLPDGKRVVFIGPDGILSRYELATGREIERPAGFEGSVRASGSPDGRFVARLDMAVPGPTVQSLPSRNWFAA